MKILISGGAPLNSETQRFLNICMCCHVIQGYGLTETTAAAAIADRKAFIDLLLCCF